MIDFRHIKRQIDVLKALGGEGGGIQGKISRGRHRQTWTGNRKRLSLFAIVHLMKLSPGADTARDDMPPTKDGAV